MTRFALFGCLVLAFGGAAAAEDKKDVPKELAPFQNEFGPRRAYVQALIAVHRPQAPRCS